MADEEPLRGRGLNIPTGADAVRGILFILLAYIVITSADATVKWVLPEVGVAMSMIARGVVGATAIILLTRGRGLRPVNIRLLALRGFLHCGVSATWYWAWGRGIAAMSLSRGSPGQGPEGRTVESAVRGLEALIMVR